MPDRFNTTGIEFVLKSPSKGGVSCVPVRHFNGGVASEPFCHREVKNWVSACK